MGIIIKSDFTSSPGTTFITPVEFSEQLALVTRSSGEVIQAHFHKPQLRTINDTQEVLFIQQGKLKVSFYSDDKKLFCSRIVSAGDVVFLSFGGHGFEVIESVKMFEVKQGPFISSSSDKIKF